MVEGRDLATVLKCSVGGLMLVEMKTSSKSPYVGRKEHWVRVQLLVTV